VKRARSSTERMVGIPSASQAFWSSSPYAGAMCTTPDPSVVVTWSEVITWKAFCVPNLSTSVKKSNSGV
jgi:hypothetical protein